MSDLLLIRYNTKLKFIDPYIIISTIESDNL